MSGEVKPDLRKPETLTAVNIVLAMWEHRRKSAAEGAYRRASEVVRDRAVELFLAGQDRAAKVARGLKGELEDLADEAGRDWRRGAALYEKLLGELRRRDQEDFEVTQADVQWGAIQRAVSDFYNAYYGEGEHRGPDGEQTKAAMMALLEAWDHYLD